MRIGEIAKSNGKCVKCRQPSGTFLYCNRCHKKLRLEREELLRKQQERYRNRDDY